jgi:DNA-binding CsgD family transcriptional regulator
VLLDEASTLLVPLGARPALARAALRAARFAGAAPTATGYPDGLTGREAEVLRLLASGKSNRAIAAMLGINGRTVERHISNVYTKIGARNRAEAAAYAVRNALL